VAASQAIVRKQLGIGLAHEVTDWFAYVTGKYDPTELKARARSLIAKVLKDEYGKVDGWWGEWRYFPVPRLKYVNRGFPYLEFDVDLYIAASLHVQLPGGEVCFQFAKPLEREAEKLKVPIVLLDGIARGDLRLLGKFKVVERDYHYVTLSVPEFGEVKLWGALIPLWRSFFRGKDLGAALESAGLLPHGSGRLISQFLPEGVALGSLAPPAQRALGESGDASTVVSALMNLGYSKKEAEQALAQAQFPPGATLEEKITITLQHLGKR